LKEELERYKKQNDDLKKEIYLENDQFDNRFYEIMPKYFTPTQINLILNTKRKVYRWSPEDISSTIILRSGSSKAYRYLRSKKNFPLPG